jgi:hypothetical protein
MVPLASLLRPWLTASSSSDSESSTRLHHSSYLVILLILSSILSGPTFPIVGFSRNLSKRFSHRGFPSRVPIESSRDKLPTFLMFLMNLLSRGNSLCKSAGDRTSSIQSSYCLNTGNRAHNLLKSMALFGCGSMVWDSMYRIVVTIYVTIFTSYNTRMVPGRKSTLGEAFAQIP